MGEMREGNVKLKNVRLSFENLFEPQEGKVDKETGKKGDPKFNCSFLMSKTDADGKANKAAILAVAEQVKKKKWGNNIPKLRPDKVCLRDGDQEDWDGYEGHLYVSASSPVSKPPVLIDRKKDAKGKWIQLRDAHGNATPGAKSLLYSGCYVNAIVNVWAQDNEHGKRINASIETVQFLRHGEAFGAKAIDPDEAFDDDDVEGFDDDADIGGGGDADDDDDDTASFM